MHSGKLSTSRMCADKSTDKTVLYQCDEPVHSFEKKKKYYSNKKIKQAIDI